MAGSSSVGVDVGVGEGGVGVGVGLGGVGGRRAAGVGGRGGGGGGNNNNNNDDDNHSHQVNCICLPSHSLFCSRSPLPSRSHALILDLSLGLPARSLARLGHRLLGPTRQRSGADGHPHQLPPSRHIVHSSLSLVTPLSLSLLPLSPQQSQPRPQLRPPPHLVVRHRHHHCRRLNHHSHHQP